MQSSSTINFWVGLGFIIFAALSFAFNLWRDRRNRRLDQIERTQQAALIQQQLREQTTVTKTETADIAAKVEQQLREQTAIVKAETADIAAKVEQALQQQQTATDATLTKQAEAVEEVLHNQEIATRTDVSSGTAQIIVALNKFGEKADAADQAAQAAYKEANTFNSKLDALGEAGLLELTKNDMDKLKSKKE